MVSKCKLSCAAAAAGLPADESHRFHFTVQMQRRSEHQKLRKFVKLIELMVRNTLHEQVIQGVFSVTNRRFAARICAGNVDSHA